MVKKPQAKVESDEFIKSQKVSFMIPHRPKKKLTDSPNQSTKKVEENFVSSTAKKNKAEKQELEA